MIAAVKKILSVAEAGGVPPDNAAELFELYIDSILAGGERLHLFSRSELTPRRVTDHHILDAVAALHFARPKKGARLLDYGAGSGVVGITWKRPPTGSARVDEKEGVLPERRSPGTRPRGGRSVDGAGGRFCPLRPRDD